MRYGDRIPFTDSQRAAMRKRIEDADAERERSRRAWARLCGLASPIGGPATGG